METTLVQGYTILSFDKQCNRKDFSCGVPSLDEYIKKQAGQDNRKRTAVTYLLHDNERDKVAGYYTLSAAVVELRALPEVLQKKLPKYPAMPATLIGRLAVDNDYKKQGLGELLLIDALNRSYLASLNVASCAVVVDAINKHAEQFYKEYGFLDLTSPSKRLFLPMTLIEKIVDL